MLWMLPLAVASGNGQVESICWERFSCEILFQHYLEACDFCGYRVRPICSMTLGPPPLKGWQCFIWSSTAKAYSWIK